MTPWVMIEVFALSILVALVKLTNMADVLLGVSLYAIFGLMFVLSATLSILDLHDVWERIAPVSPPREPSPANDRPILCHTCGLLNAPDWETTDGRCRRCRDDLHPRKPNSIQRTWALVIAAMICYLPANMMPIMISGYGGWRRSDTIMEGVIYMLLYDRWVLAVIIFVASVLVPLTKILILLYLLISVRLRSCWRPRDQTRLYRITEIIGKWSMVDIYVVAIMAALVNLGNFGFVRAGLGAIFFGAVVVLTMIAAMSFDPRLIWDAEDGGKGVNVSAGDPAEQVNRDGGGGQRAEHRQDQGGIEGREEIGKPPPPAQRTHHQTDEGVDQAEGNIDWNDEDPDGQVRQQPGQRPQPGPQNRRGQDGPDAVQKQGGVGGGVDHRPEHVDGDPHRYKGDQPRLAWLPAVPTVHNAPFRPPPRGPLRGCG